MSPSPKTALLAEYALVAHALASPARLMLLEQLGQGERGVDALAERTGLAVANCSQHLQQLRRSGLVASRRDGKGVIYSLTDAKTLTLMGLVQVVAARNLAQVERILRGLSGGTDAPEPVSRGDLATRLAEGSVIVLDIRPSDEYEIGHIPGALNATLSELDRLIPDLDPGAEIVAYCRGPYCIYAHQAVAALRRRGLKARAMEGGLPDWREEGRPVHAGGRFPGTLAGPQKPAGAGVR